MATPRVGLLIPAYNEEGTIGNVILAVSGFGQVFVVDDGSHDATADIAQRHGAVVLSQGGNFGYDSALSFGLSTLRDLEFDFVVTLDADGQHDFNDVQPLLDELVAGADLVVGNRPQKARFMERAFGLFTNSLWGVGDPLCGMKGYQTSLLLRKSKLKSYNSVGTEVLMFALNHGFTVKSIPISGRERLGKSRFAGVLRGNFIIAIALVVALTNFLGVMGLQYTASRQK